MRLVHGYRGRPHGGGSGADLSQRTAKLRRRIFFSSGQAEKEHSDLHDQAGDFSASAAGYFVEVLGTGQDFMGRAFRRSDHKIAALALMWKEYRQLK